MEAVTKIKCLLCHRAIEDDVITSYKDHLLKEHNVFYGMDYIIQGTIEGGNCLSSEHEDTQSPLEIMNDDDSFIGEVPQDSRHDGNEIDKSTNNSVMEEGNDQFFTYAEPLTEESIDISSQEDVYPADKSIDLEGVSPVKTCKIERVWDQSNGTKNAQHNTSMNTLMSAQVLHGRPSEVALSEEVPKEEVISLSSDEGDQDIIDEYNDSKNNVTNLNTDEKRGHPCWRCGTSFERRKDLMKHVTTLRGKPRLDCGTSRQGLEARMKVYAGTRKTDPCRSLTVAELKKFREWRDASIAKCAICGWEEPRSQFGQHLRQWHKTVYRLYKIKHGLGIHLLKEHQCKICDQFVELEVNELQKHFEKQHKLKIVDYYMKYVSGMAKAKFAEVPKAMNQSDDAFCDSNKWREIDHLLKEEMENAFDKCEYFCRICSEEFHSAQPLINHLRIHPGATRASNDIRHRGNFTVNKDYGSLRTKSVRHNCLVCDKETFHTRAHIAKHLRIDHPDVMLHEYYKMYIGDKSALEALSRMRTDISKIKEESAELLRDLDKCEYFCRICNAEFWKGSKVISHIQSNHHDITLDEYKERFGPLLTKLIMHRCRICGSSFRHMKTNIENHLRSHHESEFSKGLSIKIYHKRFMNGQWYNQCWFDCRACQEKFMSHSDLEKHLKLNHIFKTIKEFTDSLGPIKTNTCRICRDKFFSKSKLEAHIQQEHIFENVDAYIDTLGPLMTKSVTHECRLCNEMIHCTESDINEHLSGHDISLDNYNERFMYAETGSLEDEDTVICDAPEDETSWVEDSKVGLTVTAEPDCFIRGESRSLENDDSGTNEEANNVTLDDNATVDKSKETLTVTRALDYYMRGESYVCSTCHRAFRNLNGVNGHLAVHKGRKARKQRQ